MRRKHSLGMFLDVFCDAFSTRGWTCIVNTGVSSLSLYISSSQSKPAKNTGICFFPTIQNVKQNAMFWSNFSQFFSSCSSPPPSESWPVANASRKIRLLHLPVRADLPHFHSSVPCCCSNSEIIALGFRAGVQTVSESTTAKCGHGDYYNWRLSDDNSVEATDPPLPPGCLLPYWSTVFPITRLCEVIVRGIKVETLFHFFSPNFVEKIVWWIRRVDTITKELGMLDHFRVFRSLLVLWHDSCSMYRHV